MTATIDGRPSGLNAYFRPGKTHVHTQTWTVGYLAGRTFTATLDAATLTVDVDGDVMTITATAAQTTTAGVGSHAFTLTETTGGISEALVIGTWTGSVRAAESSTSTVNVTTSAADVAVTVTGGGLTSAAVARQGLRRRGQGAVCFVWDDGWDTQPAAAALFDARGMQATFAITTGLVGTASHVSAAQVRSLAARGHEIAAHGIQHVTGLPGLTAAQRATEYTTCLDWFEPNGIARPTTWVYTFGGVSGRSDDTDRELWGRVDRVMDTGAVPPATIGVHRDFPQFVVRRLHIESDVAQSFDSGRLLIEQAAQYPVVTSFYLHQFNNGAANTLTAAELADLLDLCVELDVPVITAAEALPKHDPLVHGGFEQDPSGWVYTASGGVGEIVTDTPAVGLPGSRSLHLSAGVGQFVYARHPVLVKPGISYTLSGRYRTSAGLGGATAKVRINQLNYKGGSVTQATTPLAESTSWARFSVATTLDAATTHVDVDCLFQPGVAGEAWYDHLCFLPTSAGAYG